MKTIELDEMKFSNDSVFTEPIEVLVMNNTLADLVTWLYDHCFWSWDVNPEFTIEELFFALKTEWLDAGGELGEL